MAMRYTVTVTVDVEGPAGRESELANAIDSDLLHLSHARYHMGDGVTEYRVGQVSVTATATKGSVAS